MKGLVFHPNYPFMNVFHIRDLYKLQKEALCFFWYFFEAFTIAMSFNTAKLLQYLIDCQFGQLSKEQKHTLTLLQWFLPAHQWTGQMAAAAESKKYCVVVFRRPRCYLTPISIPQDGKAAIYHSPLSFIHAWVKHKPATFSFKLCHEREWMSIRKCLAAANGFKTEEMPKDVVEGVNACENEDPHSKIWNDAHREYIRTHITKGITMLTNDELAVWDYDKESGLNPTEDPDEEED
ncbi:hypothetical protein Hanom_Chr07g00589631 [Helianthus anomalus]